MEDCFENVDGKTQCVCCTITSLIVLVTAALAFSFGSVEPTEYGILYNRITKRIDEVNIQDSGL